MTSTIQIGKVHHLEFNDGERAHFIPREQQKNGRYKGPMWDGGAAGRSAKKPVTKSTDMNNANWNNWKITPDDQIPPYVKAFIS